MKLMAERLVGEMELSDLYKRQNFGAVMGPDFPELAKEILANKHIATKLSAHWLVEMISRTNGVDMLKGATEGPWQVVQNHPEIAEQVLSFLYWGIRIGRDLEKEEAAVLKSLEPEQA